MSKIEETLKKIAADTSKGSSPISSNIDAASRSSLPGDPNCPICHGIGFLRQDVPVGHPDFGRAMICPCRQSEVSSSIRNRLYRLSNLENLKDLTFENFNRRGRMGVAEQQASSLEQAFNHAQMFAGNLKGWLLLQGTYGCGKTHLAAAIANFTVSLGVPTLFITVPDLLDWMRFSYDSPEATFEQRFDEIRNIGLLVLDDFGTQNATPWAQEKLFQILNYRYISRLPLVITTNLDFEDIEERIRSRMSDPDLVTRLRIQAPDYRDPQKDTSHPELSSLGLLSNRTFGTFNLRNGEGLAPEDLRNLEKAFNVAQEFAERPKGWLVFSGTYGCGKTHLAAAIGNYRASLGNSPQFLVVPDLLDHLRATFSPSSSVSLDHRFDEVRTADLLILDDLGTQSTTPWATEKLYQLFNYRYNAEKPTVITTSLTLNEIDGRIRSRMLDERLCKFFGITAPTYYGKPAGGGETKSSTPRRARHGTL
jgi:DNA replication protein DnaC